jgi:hypothetical protein
MKQIPKIFHYTENGYNVLQKNWEAEIKGLGFTLQLLIPSGVKSNGGNIPRIFWCILSPHSPLLREEYFIHDFLCDLNCYALADLILEQLLIQNNNVPKYKRISINKAVKFAHWVLYQKPSSFDFKGLTKPQKVRFLFKKIINKKPLNVKICPLVKK